ncbi:uncharacterized protein BKCO1_6500025 [Diplodia corticola]|uniref:Uncharacterized protein n=1 Tax=Diplodia corticola TaxID=236234 RepID=A0A1J9QNZ5_9PEZI|nr:uncharacterized protein BKCO1_6500025 [Diplodia corticola]OJD30168.1 hypothetical protein BKCO1_6500025 [Diplodia corticola]
MTRPPNPPPVPYERTINAAWTRSMYAETAKEMRSFQPEVPDPWTMPKSLGPAEIAYYGRLSKRSTSSRVRNADSDLTILEQRGREGIIQECEKGELVEDLQKEKHMRKGKDKDMAVTILRPNPISRANEENEQIVVGREDERFAIDSRGRRVNVGDCDERTKEEKDLDKLCDWTESKIYSARTPASRNPQE